MGFIQGFIKAAVKKQKETPANLGLPLVPVAGAAGGVGAGLVGAGLVGGSALREMYGNRTPAEEKIVKNLEKRVAAEKFHINRGGFGGPKGPSGPGIFPKGKIFGKVDPKDIGIRIPEGKRGVLFTGEKATGAKLAPHLLGHELGHITRKRLLPIKMLSSIGAVGKVTALLAPVIGGLVSSSQLMRKKLPKEERYRKARKAAVVGAGVGAAGAAPILFEEAMANVAGYKRLREAGMARKDILKGSGKVLKAFASYPALLLGGAAGLYGASRLIPKGKPALRKPVMQKKADFKAYSKDMKSWAKSDVTRAAKSDHPSNTQEQTKDVQDFAMAARAELERRRAKK